MNAELETRWGLYGSRVRLLLGRDDATDGEPSQELVDDIHLGLLDAQQKLSRFDPDSEISRVNDWPGTVVTVSPLLELALHAALEAARMSGGLVDPTILPELEAAGYTRSLDGQEPAPLGAALAAAPPRRPASTRATSRWPEVEVSCGRLSRPSGVRIDVGGTAKGLIADLVAARLEGRFTSFAIDVGGDLRVGGLPRPVHIPTPLPQIPSLTIERSGGAVATSGISRRIWSRAGEAAHHLIDPGSGRPAWTGVLQATALAPDGVTAERLAKEAFLRGPAQGLEVLSEFGGAVYTEEGVFTTGAGWGRR